MVARPPIRAAADSIVEPDQRVHPIARVPRLVRLTWKVEVYPLQAGTAQLV